MATPERSGRVPISVLSNPKTAFPPPAVQVARSWLRRNSWVSQTGTQSMSTVLRVVVSS
jgi:hypothetical protein